MHKYQMHNHTKQCSACADIDGKQYISLLKQQGYDGLFITDHFYHGNTKVDFFQSWPKFVSDFMKGYKVAKEEGDKQDFKVFFGFEECFDGDEYLVYGVDENFLLNTPQAADWTRSEMSKLVHEYGGCVIQAHPLRDAWYLDRVYLNLRDVDGIEIVNTANSDSSNILALAYAKHFDLKGIVGSDIHHLKSINPNINGYIEYEKPLESTYDFAKRILNNDFPNIYYPEISKECVASNKMPVTLISSDYKNITNSDLKRWVEDIGYKFK